MQIMHLTIWRGPLSTWCPRVDNVRFDSPIKSIMEFINKKKKSPTVSSQYDLE